MPSIWSYADPADRGFGLFKRRIFRELERLGWEVFLAEAPLLQPESKAVLRQHLFRHPCEWMLLINQSAGQLYDYLEIPTRQRPLPHRKLVWYLDDPRFFIDRPFEPSETVLCFDETYLDTIRERHTGVSGFWPLAADVTSPGDYEERFACEVCFVGGVIDQSERRAQLPQPMQAYVDELVELKLAHRERSFDELAAEHPIAPGKRINITPQVAHYLYWETNNRYRLRIMQSLQDFDVRIYGTDDWRMLLRDSPLLERFHGPIDPVRETPNCYASAAINLNIHSIQCRGSLNQRDFNAPMAGGFLLSDWVPAAGRYFQPGLEAIYWSDPNDLRAKVSYYLKHPDERREIAERGRARVLRSHTYAHRVGALLETLGIH